MRKRIMDKIHEYIYNKDMPVNERIFRLILMFGEIISVVACVETIFTSNRPELGLPLLILIILLMLATIATFRFHKIKIASYLLGFFILFIIFPCMFFLGGGMNSGATVWFLVGFFYGFMMFRGWEMLIFQSINVGVIGGIYLMAARFPQYIVKVENVNMAYFDSFFSVLMVGLMGGGFLFMQLKLYENESKEVKEKTKALAKASETQNVFFTSMSHELRTPINTVIGLNEMILRKSQEEETRDYAQKVQYSSKMLLDVINDLLDISQLRLKKMDIVPKEYDTREMFVELISLIAVRAEEKGLNFEIDIDENLPSRFLGDEKRLKQVMVNLLNNAVKYTKEGSIALRLECESVGPKEVELIITVKDTGIGIRKEDLEQLYSAFARVDKKENTEVEGSGLGLSITKQIVDLMDGQITVDSIYTKGTTFTVHLRQQVVDAAPVGNIDYMNLTSVTKDPKEYYEKSFTAPEARILLVDDSEMNTYVITQLLSETGVQIDIARSGEEALKRSREKYYHVILMDYQMPEMTGAETLIEMRRLENGLCRDSAAILLSANTPSESQRLVERYGFQGYLEKPIRADRLEESILALLPEDVVEYRKNQPNEGDVAWNNRAFRRKKRLYITTDCVCDLPEELLDRYDIRVMYLYIHTNSGRFSDTREIDSDCLEGYLDDSENSAYAESATVEEYEEFFANALNEAETVVHISLASCAGVSFSVAKTAAECFDHVMVVDSSQISGGEALMVLYASQLSREGYSAEEIVALVEKKKQFVETSFLMRDSQTMFRNHYTNRVVNFFCTTFGVRPAFRIGNSHFSAYGGYFGSLESAWESFIRDMLWHKKSISDEILCVTYVGLTGKEQQLIRKLLAKQMIFKQVIFQKASFSNACNAGMKTIGISYYKKEYVL